MTVVVSQIDPLICHYYPVCKNAIKEISLLIKATREQSVLNRIRLRDSREEVVGFDLWKSETIAPWAESGEQLNLINRIIHAVGFSERKSLIRRKTHLFSLLLNGRRFRMWVNFESIR